MNPNSNSQFQPPWMTVPPQTVDSQPPSAATPPSFVSPPPDTSPDTPPVDNSSNLDLVTASPFRKIVPFLAVAIVIILVVFLLKTILTKKGQGLQLISGKKSQEATLTYWGLWEPQEVIQPLLTAYKKEHPEVTVNYVFQSSEDYRERLQSAIVAGKGPDIFRLHATWLPMFLNQSQLSAVPDSLVDWNDYYPVVGNLKVKGQYYALPLGFDTLALFYNTDLFTAASLSPPTTWEGLRNAASKLVVKDESGRIQVAGIALGTTNNIDNWSDILGLMMLQNGADLANPTDNFAAGALKFYNLFYRSSRVWDETLPPSTYAFATGKVAMIIAPSWRVFEIAEINPKLNFKIIAVPQLTEDKNLRVAWASFWAEAVAQTSPNQAAAWEFLKFLSRPENLKKLYSNQSQIRLFGEPYPLKSLAKELEEHPLAAAFVKQGVYAKTWYLCSRTHDNGINDRMIKYFEDAVGSVNRGSSAESALQQAASGIKQVLNQYGLLSPQPSPKP